MHIINAQGEQEEFQKGKFCKSLEKAGVPRPVVSNACDEIERRIEPGMNTADIFTITHKLLKEINPGFAASYNLKRGIMALGPAGFFFEKYIAGILRAYDYNVSLNRMMKGKCVFHEVDVVAEKGDVHYLIEAKFRNDQKIKTDSPVAMYAYARLLDITAIEEAKEATKKKHNMWLFTNAKFTTTAIKYAQCMGLRMTGWSYPQGESLEDIIKAKMLFPVTTLPSVNALMRDQLMGQGVVFAHDVLTYSVDELAHRFGIRNPRARQMLKEARLLHELKDSF